MTGSQVDPPAAMNANELKLRGDIEAWISGMESGIWNPTQAMKRRVALVLREFLARSAVVRPTRDPDEIRAEWRAYREAQAAGGPTPVTRDQIAEVIEKALREHARAQAIGYYRRDCLPAADAVLALFGVAVSDSQEAR